MWARRMSFDRCFHPPKGFKQKRSPASKINEYWENRKRASHEKYVAMIAQVRHCPCLLTYDRS